MSKLIFTLKYADIKFPVYLEEHFGLDFAKKAILEIVQTAKIHESKVQILDFRNNKAVLETLAEDQNVKSAYIIENKKVISSIK